MGQTNQVLGLLQKLKQTGLLPMLLQRAGVSPGTPQARPQSLPPQSITQVGGGGQPGVGGSPPQSGAAPPNVAFDPSGAGGTMPPLTPQPHEMVQGIASLLMNWNERKKKGQEAEAENIAARLTQAIKNKDTNTIDLIKNDPHQMKIMDKVFKGWRTKMEQAQKPGKEEDPTITGFERGISKATQPQPQVRGTPPGAGGFQAPQPSQAEQLGAAKTSAELQAAQKDPNRLLSSRLSSEEMRQTELGAGPEKVAAEREAAKAKMQTALSSYQKADAEMRKAQAELQIKMTEARSAEKKGEISIDIEKNRALTAATNLEIAKARLRLVVGSAGGRAKEPPLRVKTQWDSLQNAMKTVEALEKQPPTWHFGAPPQEFRDLQSQLKMAGLASVASVIPSTAPFFGSTDVKGMISTIKENLISYRDSFQQGIMDNYPKWKPPGVEVAPGDEEPDEEVTGEATEPKEGEPMEGDIVDGYYFKGGDPGKQENYREATPEEIKKSEAKKP